MLRSRQAEGEAVIGIFLSLCWILVGLRVYVRLKISKSFGLDDWLLIMALGCFSVYCASAIAAIFHGVGLDPKLIPLKDFPYAVMFWWLAALFYNVTTLLIRLSISVFMLKICTQRTHKIIIWTVMGVVTAYSIFYFFISLFQCNPPDFFWRKYMGGRGKCIGDNIIPITTYVHSTLSAVADWTLGLLPIWLIWGLQMNMRTKVSVGILLGLGLIAGVAAIIRIPYVQVLGDKKMFLYNVVDVSLWSLAETALGMIAASCAALRPLFKKFYQLTTSGTYSKSNTRSQTLVNRFMSSSKTKSRSKSRTRSFGVGNSLGHGYVTELHSNPSTAAADAAIRRGEPGVSFHGSQKKRGMSAQTFYKSDDESSLEMGNMDGQRETHGVMHGTTVVGMGSEENLTGEKGRGSPKQRDLEMGTGDIHVHTLVEVVSGRKD